MDATKYEGDQKWSPHRARWTSGQPWARISREVFVLIAPTNFDNDTFGG